MLSQLLKLKNGRPISMNICDNYVPEWGAWEAYREVECNAWDQDDRYRLERDGGDLVIFTTRGVCHPRMFTTMGAGNKRGDEKSIGQFGEGFKLAALVVTRMGGDILVNLPEHDLSFVLIDDPDVGGRVLHYIIVPAKNHPDECRVMLRLPGIAGFRDRMLGNKESMRLTRKLPDAMRLFVRGVWIKDIKTPSLFDWSLADVELNRDRAIVDSLGVQYRLLQYMNKNMDLDMAMDIIRRPETFEAKAIECWSCSCSDTLRGWLAQAYAMIHGRDTIMASENADDNAVAEKHGYSIAAVNSGLRDVLLSAPGAPVRSASQIRREHAGASSDELKQREAVIERLREAIAKLNVDDWDEARQCAMQAIQDINRIRRRRLVGAA